MAIWRRCFSVTVSRAIQSRALVFSSHGEPAAVLRCETLEIGPPKANEARVRFLLSALNPADINVIQGKYPVKPKANADGLTVVGNEGVGIIEELGSETSSSALQQGDWVVCGRSQLGTWTSCSNIDASELITLPKTSDGKASITEAQAAMIAVNPATAYRLLRDFVDLKPGDWIVQNGANSAAAQNVLQLCKLWGIKTINVIRDRPSIARLTERLTALGATHILTEQQLGDMGVVKTIKESVGESTVRLGLNCVSGPATSLMTRFLSMDATLVTYGGMSKRPFEVGSGRFIFHGLTCTGFWLSKWYETQQPEARANMIAELASLYEQGELKEPGYEIVELEGDDEAITQLARGAIAKNPAGFGGKKMLFRFASP